MREWFRQQASASFIFLSTCLLRGPRQIMHVKAFGKQLKLYNANSITNQLALKFLIIVLRIFKCKKMCPTLQITNTMLFSVFPTSQRQKRENPSSFLPLVQPLSHEFFIVPWNHCSRWSTAQGFGLWSPTPSLETLLPTQSMVVETQSEHGNRVFLF